MSRIGNNPINVPEKVKLNLKDNVLDVQGPKGQLQISIPEGLEYKFDNNIITLSRANDEKKLKSLHGLTRALIANAIEGVSSADGKPEMLKTPRKGGADDLKQIKGVGPKLEKLLNKLGFYHFDQVASWRVKEVKWVDENLQGFKGRVSRDEWVKQAKVLAKGGQTDFSKKVKKGGVY